MSDFRKAALLLTSLCGAGTGLAPSLAHAEPGRQAGSIEEIIVTAQRREDALIDVPVAVTVIGEQALRRSGVRTLNDLSGFAPNFSFEDRGAETRDQRLVIRGVSSETGFIGAESAVGLVIDGVFISGVAGMNTDLFDLRQVEVLRGPQGTLFGRNTTAGVINVTTHRPGPQVEARSTFEVGAYDHARVRASLRGPLAGDLYGGVTLMGFSRGGFSKLANGVDIDTKDSLAGRLDFVWEPRDGWDVRLTGDYQFDDHIRSAFDTTEPGRPEAARDRILPREAFPPTLLRQVYGASLTARAPVGDYSLTSITAYRSRILKERNDSDAFSAPQSAFDRRNREFGEELSQELQLASPDDRRLTWLAGVYLQTQTTDFRGQYIFAMDDYWREIIGPFVGGASLRTMLGLAGASGECNLPPPNCLRQVSHINWVFDTDTAAVYGNARYQVTERMDLQLGARLAWERKRFSYASPAEVSFPFPAAGPFAPFRSIFVARYDTKAEAEDVKFLPRASLGYQITPQVKAYASVAQGYKSANFIGNSLGFSDANNNGLNDYEEFLQVGAETSWTYELGVKGSAAQVYFNLVGYYIDYEGLQTNGVLVNPLGGRFSYLTNADLENYGVELELSAAVTEWLSLSGSLGYNHAEFTDYAGCEFVPANPVLGTQNRLVDCDGRRPSYAPRWTGGVRGDLTLPLGGTNLNLIGSADVSFKSRQFFNPANRNGQGGYGLLNGSLGVEDAAGRWSVVAWGRNLTDKTAYQMAVPFQTNVENQTSVLLRPPRTYGLRLELRY